MIVFLGYLLINIFFNFNIFWRELIFDRSKLGAVWGEVQAYEWLTDKFYLTLIHGGNPFDVVKNMLYPFGISLGLVDSGNAFYYIFLRPFFSLHQSMAIVMIISLLLANLGMYLLLRKLSISKFLAFIIGAAYGYMTFLMPRGGHLSYWCHYLFPWFYYCVTSLILDKKKIIKILSSVGIAFFFVMMLWSNFYYFIILLISIISFFSYFLVKNAKIMLAKIKEIWKYVLFIIILTLIFLIPWLFALYNQIFFDIIPKTEGWGGAIEFASDLFNYFIPSGYGYYITKYPFLAKPFSLLLQLYTPGSRSIFENFTYPGIIILSSYFLLIVFYKKIAKKTKILFWPFLFVSIIIFILTLGPFLHVLGHWTLTVDEGIKIVVPLPYIILHYIPLLNNIRVPGRLIVGFIFFAYVVSAFVLNDLFKNLNNKNKIVFFALLFFIFIVDHRYKTDILSAPKQIFPNKIYKEISKDQEFSTVLEVPFTVRDGFTYFGNGDAFQMIVGESIHGKPVLGGYTGRIANYKKDYYMKNPFFGYLGRMIDGGIQTNPIIDKNDLINWLMINTEESRKTIDFLDLKYIIVNNNYEYTASISAVLKEIGFEKKLDDVNRSLWVKPLEKKEFTKININDPSSIVFLGFGWHDPEVDFRWVDRRSSAMFKIQKTGKYSLNFKTAAFNKDQQVTIYLNKKKITRINVSTNINEYAVPINIKLEQGINTVYFTFDKDYRPAELFPGNLDKRQLSAKFYELFITESN